MVKIALCLGAEASGGGGPNFGLDGPAGLPMIAPRPPQGVSPAKREVKFQLMGQPGVGQGLHRTEGARPGRAAGRHGAAT